MTYDQEPTMTVKEIDETTFDEIFGSGIVMALGVDATGEEPVLVVRSSTENKPQQFPDTDIKTLFDVKSTKYVKCDSNGKKWVCNKNGYCVYAGTC